MPKSNKKKKDKSADFTKAKLKLGKGKRLANNATDTSFKARSIVLPHQTIGLDKDVSTPTTRRKLTVDDLLIHLKHYNSTTRKDAIHGLRELLEAHPQLVETTLASIIQSCARIVGDEDADVRKALLEFLSWFLRLVPLEQLQPHAPFLILFITSAQTHIFPAIRIDAIRFLDQLLEFVPHIVTRGWDDIEATGNRILEGYLGLLGASSGFGTIQDDNTPALATLSINLSLNSKLIILSSLATYLSAAISSSPSRQLDTSSSWYTTFSFTNEAEFRAFCTLIQPSATPSLQGQQFEWSDAEGIDFEDFSGNFMTEWPLTVGSGFSLEELGDVRQGVGSLTSDTVTTSISASRTLRLAKLTNSLHPILLSAWLDVAPTIFGVGAPGSKIESQIAVSIGRIAVCLYGNIFHDQILTGGARATATNNLATLLGYMSTYLPYISETDTQLEQLLRSLNFAYCELTSLAVIGSQQGALNSKQGKTLSAQVDTVGDYVVQVLDGESQSQPLGYSLTALSYVTLLPTIWSLLRYRGASGDDAVSHRMFTSTVRHAIRTSSKSSTKAVATQFVGALVLMNDRTISSSECRITFTPDECELLKEWYLQLPKVLWEVGAGDQQLTEMVLRLLLRISQRRLTLFDATTFASVRSRLIPYFFTVHPHKGDLLGPFTKLKQWPSLRRLTLDVTFALMQDISSSEGDELRTAVGKAVNGTLDAHHWNALLCSSSCWCINRI